MGVPLVPPSPDDFPSAFEHGAACLRWLLDVGEGFGFLTDEALRRADHAGIVAVAPRALPLAALDRVSAVRYRIACVLAARAKESPDVPTVPPPCPVDVRGTSRVPVTPGPASLPPTGASVRPVDRWEF